MNLKRKAVSYSIDLERPGFGVGDDVEYHTTNHIELDNFYARAGEIRDVCRIRSTHTMLLVHPFVSMATHPIPALVITVWKRYS